MVLPTGFERINEKLYEEVNIPATDRPPEDFSYMPVYIDSLDDVCWLLSLLDLKLSLVLCPSLLIVFIFIYQ